MTPSWKPRFKSNTSRDSDSDRKEPLTFVNQHAEDFRGEAARDWAKRQEEAMKPSAEEIAQRLDAITPILAANAEACVQARSVVPESMKAMVEAGAVQDLPTRPG
jgi:hypothetical protein